jgi:hypothetical protein
MTLVIADRARRQEAIETNRGAVDPTRDLKTWMWGDTEVASVAPIDDLEPSNPRRPWNLLGGWWRFIALAIILVLVLIVWVI